MRMLFLDFCSAFNNIIPGILAEKHQHLGLLFSICTWSKDFLTERPQSVWLGLHLSSTITLNTGSSQGCALSPLLLTLYTSDCTLTHSAKSIIRFADNTTVAGLISGEDKSNYRDEVSRLERLCSGKNLHLRYLGMQISKENLSWAENATAAVQTAHQFLKSLEKKLIWAYIILTNI